MQLEDPWIYPRVKALRDEHGTIADAAAAFAKQFGLSYDAVRVRMQHTFKGDFVSRIPLSWRLPWPYDLYEDRACDEKRLKLVFQKGRILVNSDGLIVKSPAETFDPPHDVRRDNMITDATGSQLGDEVESNVLEPIYDAREVPQTVDELLAGFERAQAEKKLHDRSQIRCRVDFRDQNLPIAVMGYSDVHWGSEDVDYNAIRRHVELLKTIPNLYAFCLGDVNEFAKLKHRGAVEGQIHSPTVQARAARAVFLETWEKWLTVVLGNHDMRVFLESGFDIGEYLIGEVPPGKKRIPFMRDGGLVTIELGQQVYTVNVFHGDSAFGTRFNENHKGRQTARLVDGRTDAQFNGHTHNPAVQDTSEPSDDMQGARSAVYVQCGSYKVLGDDHARRRKYLEVSDVQMGTIIAFPDTHRILGFKRVEEAVVILNALTEHYERGGSITDYMP